MSGPLVGNQPEMPVINDEDQRIVITFWKLERISRKIRFKTYKKNPLGRLKRLACEKFRLRYYAIRFRHDGIDVKDYDTCETLEIENGDTIEMFNAQGIREIILFPHVLSGDRILLKILRWDSQTYCYYSSLRNMPVILVIQRHCREWGDNFCAQRYSYEGRRLHKLDTPASLGMQNGNTVEIFYAQEGGGSF